MNERNVDDFVAVGAHDFNRVQRNFNAGLQAVQYQSITINKVLPISIGARIWFGTRWSTRKSLSEVLYIE